MTADTVPVTQNLLPCPFCGSEHPSMKRADAVWCGSCLAEIPEHDEDVPNAVSRWNTRFTPSPEAAPAAEVELQKLIDGILWTADPANGHSGMTLDEEDVRLLAAHFASPRPAVAREEIARALVMARKYVAWYNAAQHNGPWRDHENSAHLKQIDAALLQSGSAK